MGRLIEDSGEFTLTCEKCGHEFDETVGRAKREPYLACPKCGHRVDTGELVQLFERLEKNLTDFGRGLEDKFGK